MANQFTCRQPAIVTNAGPRFPLLDETAATYPWGVSGPRFQHLLLTPRPGERK